MAKNKNNDAYLINHLGLVRVRVQGSGYLRITAYSLDEVSSETLEPIVMADPTKIVPTVLANFKEQKMQIELRTIEIDEYMKFTTIVPFTKPTAASYPM